MYCLGRTLGQRFNDSVQNPVVTRKVQSWKSHVFNVVFLPSIVFPSSYDTEISFGEQNEILGIDITLGALLVTFTGLVELRLQVSSRIVSCIIFWIRNVAPTRSELTQQNL